MSSLTFTFAALVALSNGLALNYTQDTPYHYMPVDYDYGYNSRVTANITYGTAPDEKSVKTVMDTGSANFWVWEKGAIIHWGATGLGVEGPCNETVPAEYDPKLSPTSVVINDTSGYSYGGNSKMLYGERYSNDTITVTGGNKPIPNTQFAMENYGRVREGSSECSPIEYDLGILGLSPYTNRTDGPSFKRNLFDAGKVLSKVMVMWFDKHVGNGEGILGRMTGGTLFGAIDHSKYTGPLVRVPNVRSDYQIGYYVPKPNVTINGITFYPDEKDTNCLLDSGTKGDALPFAYDGTEVTRFFNESGLVNYNGVIAYNGSCDSVPDDLTISYTFPGVNAEESITIDMLIKNYVRGYGTDKSGDLCLLNVESGGCIFGAPFLSAATIVMDDEDLSIAFAKGGVSEKGSGLDLEQLQVFGKGESFDATVYI